MPRFVIAPSSPRPSTSIQGSQGSGSLLKRMTGLGLGLGLAMGLALVWVMGWPFASAQAQRLERVSPFLEHPWGMSFIDARRLLVTERTGQVLLVDLDQGAATPLTGVPKAVVDGQGGMLDVLYDRGEVFLCYAGPASLGRKTTTLGVGRLEGTALVGFTQMFQAANPGYGSHHFGCRIGLDPAGKLYLTLGDRGTANSAQETDNHQGAVIRLNRDGSVPADNPFIGVEDARSELFTIGHRNPQGLAIHPDTGAVWINEHGPKGGDEINLLVAGENYGWPLYTFGRSYGGAKIGKGTGGPGYADSLWHWTPSIAPSDMTFVPAGSQFPEYEGDLMVTSLKFRQLHHVEIEAGQIVADTVILQDSIGRLRDVEVGPDGAIYLLNDEDQGALYRLSQ